jgi:predicted nucleic acid-binding protein
MKLFLDTSVLLAACGSARGSSRALFGYAPANGWTLIASPWVVTEVVRNLRKFPPAATHEWLRFRSQLTLVDDVLSINRVVVFPVSKDRPVLLTALATSHVLLTLDRDDFAGLLGSHFYGLPLMPPSEFLECERRAGRLKPAPTT